MYPTQKQILQTKPDISKKIIDATLLWKTNHLKRWRDYSTPEKIKNLHTLINILTTTHQKENKNYKKTLKIKNDLIYAYNTDSRTIFLDKNNPSIISTLHELAHHLYGPSELSACRWSVWLFKECFPGLYKKLEWKGHLLTKK